MCLARGISPGADAATAVGSAWGGPRKKLQIGDKKKDTKLVSFNFFRIFTETRPSMGISWIDLGSILGRSWQLVGR